MVEKIDRPEPPPAYRVDPAKETKDNRSSQQQTKKEPDQFKRQSEIKLAAWKKFREDNTTVKIIRVLRQHIRGCLFKSVSLQKGAVILEAVVQWTNGRETDGAIFRLSGFDNFLKLKNLKPHQEVPDVLWAKEALIELAIPQVSSPSGTFAINELEKDAENSQSIREARPRWWVKYRLITALALAGILLTIIVALILTR